MTAVSARRAAFDVRPVVMIDTTAASQAVVIEVSGADRPGLLAELATAIAAEGLSLRSAHVANFGERAVDAFYVTDAAGRKPTRRTRLDRLAATLEAVLDRARLPDPSPGQRPITPVRASVRDVSDLGRLSGRSPDAAGQRASRSRRAPGRTDGQTPRG